MTTCILAATVCPLSQTHASYMNTRIDNASHTHVGMWENSPRTSLACSNMKNEKLYIYEEKRLPVNHRIPYKDVIPFSAGRFGEKLGPELAKSQCLKLTPKYLRKIHKLKQPANT